MSYARLNTKQLNKLKGLPVKFEQLIDPKLMDEEDRFTNLAFAIQQHILRWSLFLDCPSPKIAIEGYSFGSRFTQAHKIGEATGHLITKIKDLRYLNVQCEISRPSPMTVKSAVKTNGKTSAGKEAVYDSFCDTFGFDLRSLLDIKKLGSPVTDICDSWACSRTIGAKDVKTEKKTTRTSKREPKCEGSTRVERYKRQIGFYISNDT